MLIALLKDRLSTDRAIVLLEDAHWMDAASWALTEELIGKVPQALFILALRTVDDVERHLTGALYERLSLLPMAEKETRSILAQALNCQGVTSDVVNLVHGKAAGNPLFTTQLGLALLNRTYWRSTTADCALAVSRIRRNLQPCPIPFNVSSYHASIDCRLPSSKR